nr:MAG TPA: hypothetical protein [Bacteriophage sp.]
MQPNRYYLDMGGFLPAHNKNITQITFVIE